MLRTVLVQKCVGSRSVCGETVCCQSVLCVPGAGTAVELGPQ